MALEFKEKDLVWAKMKGYPHWPAKITKPPPGLKAPSNKYYVLFYGTLQFGWIAPSDIYPYLEFKEKFAKSCTRSKYSEAIWQIEEDPNLLISSTVKTPQKKRKSKSDVMKKDTPEEASGARGRKRQLSKSPEETPVIKKSTKSLNLVEETDQSLPQNTMEDPLPIARNQSGTRRSGLRQGHNQTVISDVSSDSLQIEKALSSENLQENTDRQSKKDESVTNMSDSAQVSDLNNPSGALPPPPLTSPPTAKRYSTRQRKSTGLNEEVEGGYVLNLTRNYAARKEQISCVSPSKQEVKSPVKSSLIWKRRDSDHRTFRSATRSARSISHTSIKRGEEQSLPKEEENVGLKKRKKSPSLDESVDKTGPSKSKNSISVNVEHTERSRKQSPSKTHSSVSEKVLQSRDTESNVPGGPQRSKAPISSRTRSSFKQKESTVASEADLTTQEEVSSFSEADTGAKTECVEHSSDGSHPVSSEGQLVDGKVTSPHQQITCADIQRTSQLACPQDTFPEQPVTCPEQPIICSEILPPIQFTHPEKVAVCSEVQSVHLQGQLTCSEQIPPPETQPPCPETQPPCPETQPPEKEQTINLYQCDVKLDESLTSDLKKPCRKELFNLVPAGFTEKPKMESVVRDDSLTTFVSSQSLVDTGPCHETTTGSAIDTGLKSGSYLKSVRGVGVNMVAGGSVQGGESLVQPRAYIVPPLGDLVDLGGSLGSQLGGLEEPASSIAQLFDLNMESGRSDFGLAGLTTFNTVPPHPVFLPNSARQLEPVPQASEASIQAKQVAQKPSVILSDVSSEQGHMMASPSLMSVQFDHNAAVEAALQADNHAMFELDSDIISLLDQVPDTIPWGTPLTGNINDVTEGNRVLMGGSMEEVEGSQMGGSMEEVKDGLVGGSMEEVKGGLVGESMEKVEAGHVGGSMDDNRFVKKEVEDTPGNGGVYEGGTEPLVRGDTQYTCLDFGEFTGGSGTQSVNDSTLISVHKDTCTGGESGHVDTCSVESMQNTYSVESVPTDTCYVQASTCSKEPVVFPSLAEENTYPSLEKMSSSFTTMEDSTEVSNLLTGSELNTDGDEKVEDKDNDMKMVGDEGVEDNGIKMMGGVVGVEDEAVKVAVSEEVKADSVNQVGSGTRDEMGVASIVGVSKEDRYEEKELKTIKKGEDDTAKNIKGLDAGTNEAERVKTTSSTVRVKSTSETFGGNAAHELQKIKKETDETTEMEATSSKMKPRGLRSSSRLADRKAANEVQAVTPTSIRKKNVKEKLNMSSESSSRGSKKSRHWNTGSPDLEDVSRSKRLCMEDTLMRQVKAEPLTSELYDLTPKEPLTSGAHDKLIEGLPKSSEPDSKAITSGSPEGKKPLVGDPHNKPLTSETSREVLASGEPGKASVRTTRRKKFGSGLEKNSKEGEASILSKKNLPKRSSRRRGKFDSIESPSTGKQANFNCVRTSLPILQDKEEAVKTDLVDLTSDVSDGTLGESSSMNITPEVVKVDSLIKKEVKEVKTEVLESYGNTSEEKLKSKDKGDLKSTNLRKKSLPNSERVLDSVLTPSMKFQEFKTRRSSTETDDVSVNTSKKNTNESKTASLRKSSLLENSGMDSSTASASKKKVKPPLPKACRRGRSSKMSAVVSANDVSTASLKKPVDSNDTTARRCEKTTPEVEGVVRKEVGPILKEHMPVSLVSVEGGEAASSRNEEQADVAMDTRVEGASKENQESNAIVREVLNGNRPPPILYVRTGMTTVEVLRVLNYNLKASLVVDRPNIQQALMTLRDLQELPCSMADLESVPDIIYTLRKVRRYRSNAKVVKKGEEVYSQFKGLYLHPETAPPPLTRRTVVGARSKTTPTMADYLNKQSFKLPSSSKAPPLQTTGHASSTNITTLIATPSATPSKNMSTNSAPADAPLSDSAPHDQRGVGGDDGEVVILESTDGIRDVISQKPSAQTLKEMNTTHVPKMGGTEKERLKGTGVIRMKNASSSKSTNERAVRTSTRASHVNYAEESTTTESTSSKSSDSEEAANVKAEVTGESSSVKNIKKTVKEETTVDQVVPS